jgi:large subunit ribosomal protein L13
MKTFIPKVDPTNRKWWVMDLDGATMGRAAVRVANVLRGKDKPIFTPHLDTGDNVVVVNAEKVRVKGTNKPQQLSYYHYSGYPGGLKTTTFERMIEKHPERVFHAAVRRMLPKNRLGRKMLKKLHVYAGPDHRHQAQQPEIMKLK